MRVSEISRHLSFVNCHAPAEAGGAFDQNSWTTRKYRGGSDADRSPSVSLCSVREEWSALAACAMFSSFHAILIKYPPCLSWRLAIKETEISGVLYSRTRATSADVDVYGDVYHAWDRPAPIKCKMVSLSALEPQLSWQLYDCHVPTTTTLIEHALLPLRSQKNGSQTFPRRTKHPRSRFWAL